MLRRMKILTRVIVGGDPVKPGKEFNPGDEADFEDGTAKTLEEHGHASPVDPKRDDRKRD